MATTLSPRTLKVVVSAARQLYESAEEFCPLNDGTNANQPGSMLRLRARKAIGQAASLLCCWLGGYEPPIAGTEQPGDDLRHRYYKVARSGWTWKAWTGKPSLRDAMLRMQDVFVRVYWPRILGPERPEFSDLPPFTRDELRQLSAAVDELERAMGRSSRSAESIVAAIRPPLSDRESEVFRTIHDDGPITGKQIASKTGIEQATLTRHVVPALKRRNLIKNRRGSGYYSCRT